MNEKWYFTFGSRQEHENHFTVIEAINFMDARATMLKNYGNQWSHQYSEKDWSSPRNLCSHYTQLDRIDAKEETMRITTDDIETIEI